MKILFITHHYLSSCGGGSFASRAFINAFAELSDEMTLLYPVNDEECLYSGINQKIETIPIQYNVSRGRKLLNLLIGKVHRFGIDAAVLLEQRHYDLVVFDTSMVSYKLIDIVKQARSKAVVIHHNYQYEYFRDNTPLWLRFPVLFWCKRYEGEAVRKADLNLTLTKQDIKLLSERYNNGNESNFRLLGIFEYSTHSLRVLDDSTHNGHRFIITGNLSALQTKKSLMTWIKEFYPILKDVIPDASLSIAGNKPDKQLTDICLRSDINLIPSPASMDPILENADYYICPIYLGGGIKLRVMDGLKWGLPVISHVKSVRGYDSFLERGYIFPYTSVDDFRKELVRVRDNPYNRKMILTNYQMSFSFQSGIERLKMIMNSQVI